MLAKRKTERIIGFHKNKSTQGSRPILPNENMRVALLPWFTQDHLTHSSTFYLQGNWILCMPCSTNHTSSYFLCV